MNNKIRKKATAIALAGTIAATSLAGCGSTNKETYPQVAVIFDEDTATIIEYMTVSGSFIDGFIEIKQKDGSVITVPYKNTDNMLIKDKSYEEIEELIKDRKGNDITINYFNVEKAYTKKREK